MVQVAINTDHPSAAAVVMQHVPRLSVPTFSSSGVLKHLVRACTEFMYHQQADDVICYKVLIYAMLKIMLRILW
jgi:hypothetical protein